MHLTTNGIYQIMTNLSTILSNPNANIKLEISCEDLRNYSDELISRVLNEVATMKEPTDDRLLTRDEVKNLCGVCDATLWHWNKRNYLKPVKVGCKVRYRQSDVNRILGKDASASQNAKASK